MKSIYISGPAKKKGHFMKVFWALILLVILLGIMRVASPHILRNFVNKAGADDRGYTYRIADLDFKLLKGEFNIKDLKVFHKSSSVNIAAANHLQVNVDWREIFQGNKIYEIHSDVIDVFLSTHLIDEIKRIKGQAKQSVAQDVYLNKITAKVDRFNLKELENEDIRTVLSLTELEATVKDIGLGKVYDKSDFSLKSKIAEGGTFDLTGNTQKQDGSISWVVKGSLDNIPSTVFEKMAGDKYAIDLAKTNVDAVILAKSEEGIIEGELSSRIEDFKFSESKRQGLIKRGLAKITNALLMEKIDEDGSLKLNIPFTLKENLSLDVPETLRKLDN